MTNTHLRRDRYELGTFCLGVVLTVVFSLIVLNIQAVGIHAHSDGDFHHDCPICKATVAARTLVSGSVMTPECPELDAIGRLSVANQIAASEISPESPSARAPPRG
jgi:hypothetical protein